MQISAFLEEQAQQYGPEVLRGSVVFVALGRVLDNIIRYALALGPHHQGRPSPWSHCFLVAGEYQGPATRILDCTIRDNQNRLLWEPTLEESLDTLYQGLLGHGSGGIYSGQLTDYDDVHVTAVGLKFLPALSSAQRQGLVQAAEQLQRAGYRYDLPAPLRELVRLLTRRTIAPLPPGRRLFSSAFVASVYREALQGAGDFAPNVASIDVTPDDLWYSPLGATAMVSGLPQASAVPPPTFFTEGAVPPPAPAPEAPTAAKVALGALDRVATADDIQRLLQKLPGFAFIPNKAAFKSLLEDALKQRRQLDQQALGQPSALVDPRQFHLSLLQSAFPEPSPETPTNFTVLGFDDLETLDARWAASLWNDLTRSRVPFPTHQAKGLSDEAIVLPMADQVAITIAGDWGTGLATSQAIGTLMSDQAPDHTIHLGDVYYSGTESEELHKLVIPWPSGSVQDQPCFTLNSNHEMYSGGHGYFGVALAASKFKAQQGLSYFGLTNAKVAFFGLDSAYHGSRLGLYQNGVLDPGQLEWLAKMGRGARAQGKKLVILTHHTGMGSDGVKTKLWEQVVDALEGGPDFWYWGHQHAGIEFVPQQGRNGITVRARCVGHGGVPYTPLTPTAAMVWTESDRAGPFEQRGLNGFLVLRLSNTGLEEEFFDERGRSRRKNTFPL